MIPRSTGRSSPWPLLRRAVLGVIGAGCVALGMALTITLVRPETLGMLGTAQLVGIVVLLTTPGLTMLAMRYDRRTLLRRRLATELGSACEAPGAQSPLRARVAAHGAHDRRPVRHARVNEPGGQALSPEQAA